MGAAILSSIVDNYRLNGIKFTSRFVLVNKHNTWFRSAGRVFRIAGLNFVLKIIIILEKKCVHRTLMPPRSALSKIAP